MIVIPSMGTVSSQENASVTWDTRGQAAGTVLCCQAANMDNVPRASHVTASLDGQECSVISQSVMLSVQTTTGCV